MSDLAQKAKEKIDDHIDSCGKRYEEMTKETAEMKGDMKRIEEKVDRIEKKVDTVLDVKNDMKWIKNIGYCLITGIGIAVALRVILPLLGL